MNKILLFLMLFTCSLALSQESDELWEAMKLPKAVINKSYKSYSIAHSSEKNGSKSEFKQMYLDIENPFLIIISSNENGGKMTISNKSFPEDLIIPFKAIYKTSNNDDLVYLFSTNDMRYSVTYIMSIKSNDTIFLTIQKDTNNSVTYAYTLAKT